MDAKLIHAGAIAASTMDVMFWNRKTAKHNTADPLQDAEDYKIIRRGSCPSLDLVSTDDIKITRSKGRRPRPPPSEPSS